MELTMAAQEDATPWEIPSQSPSTTPNPDEPILHGRSYFSALGLVRRKPARPDAPPTLSKSCSDKLTLKQSTSLLSSITSLLISPQNCYIHSLVIPSSQYSDVACQRAFSSSGRLRALARKDKEWEGGYKFQPFKVYVTEKEFVHSRRQTLQPGEKIIPSNISSFSTARPALMETLIGGTLQGRKQFSPRGSSLTTKSSIWALALKIATLVSVPAIERCLRVESYAAVKESQLLEGRRIVKRDVRHVLGNWVRNEGGEGFDLHGSDLMGIPPKIGRIPK
jgi:tRNA-specific adenosine deaminase 1